MVRSGELTKGPEPHTLAAKRVTSQVGTPDAESGSPITAVLDDGPLRGARIETQLVQGRPPSTVDVQAEDHSTCRYCIAEWTHSGPSAKYTFLYCV
jgi:hypothetical protein